jgi:NAD(P)-dependent dehydrogenase (short-subunit alcohol dehydrogenase family)
MLLNSKNILVFAATGAIGRTTAQIFAREGAQVWLSGRNRDSLEEVVAAIKAEGGKARADVVDATDEEAVNRYVSEVAEQAGKIDGVFNAIGSRPRELGYPTPAAQLSLEQFFKPIQVIVGSTFLTSRAVARYMEKQGGGAIVTLSATLSSMTAANMANISATCGAIEALTRSLAGEYGSAGIRVNCVRGSGMPETRTIQETVAGQIELSGVVPSMSLPPIGRPITVAETAKVAAFLASEGASGMTGQVVTVCGGVFVG